MINIPAISDCFKQLIGFDQNANSSYPTLDEDMLISDSDLYVQRIHSLLTVENIYNCAKLQTSTEFKNYLKNTIKNASVKLINSFYAKKHLNENSKELISEVRLYDGTGNFNNKIVKTGRFVGFRLYVKDADISLVMRMIGIQIDTAQAAVPIYIYHSTKYEKIESFNIAYDKPHSFLWFPFTKKSLPYIKGGHYIIGYYEDDLTGQAINKDVIFGRMPNCSSCNQVNYNYYSKWFKHLRVEPFYVESSNILQDKNKWSDDKEVLTDNTNFGLNFCISLMCDLTPLFCRNRELFSNAMSLQVACEFLNDMAYSVRDNQLQQKVASMAMYALDSKENTNGMLKQLDNAINAIDFSISDINPVCLPCSNEGQRLRIKSVYG